MTGEITLRGLVLQIGGLKEKLLAAHRAGIKKVLIPIENKKDLVEVPETLEPGEYVLSFRWDSQQTPQVWNSCANIKIV